MNMHREIGDSRSKVPVCLSREALGAAISERLRSEQVRLRAAWAASRPVAHVVIDDLLSAEAAEQLYTRLPSPTELRVRASIRQRKRFGIELERYDPAVSEILFAFQQPDVVMAIEQITDLERICPDPSFYASGLSVMCEGDFVSPHLDNSHDGDQKQYRVLNVLYYMSPGWACEHGGCLELWDESVQRAATIVSAFNRMVLMKTDHQSWHSVTRVVSREPRWCASNYYFSDRSPNNARYRHVATFAGRPEERGKRFLLALDGLAVNVIGKACPWLLRRNKHRRRSEAPRGISSGQGAACENEQREV